VFTCVGKQVTLCDPIWQVTVCSCEMVFHEQLYLYLYLFTVTFSAILFSALQNFELELEHTTTGSRKVENSQYRYKTRQMSYNTTDKIIQGGGNFEQIFMRTRSKAIQ